MSCAREGMLRTLERQILQEHSRRQADRIVAWVGTDTRRFRSLVRLLLEGAPVVSQRASWPLALCGERHPALVLPYLKALMAKMQEPGTHNAVRRNVLCILQTIDLPRRLQGTAAALCFAFLADRDAPAAVKANAMTVIARIARQEPDLCRELRLVIEQQMPYGSMAFRARGRQVLAQLPPAGETVGPIQ